jgi:hypothetical protein
MLGLTPSAASDAIAQAFADATSMFRPHAFGSITELCVAYETLRDPVRRRAYDESLGLNARRTVTPVPRPASAHFMARPAAVVAVPIASPVAAPPQPAPRADPIEARPAPRNESPVPPEPLAVEEIGFAPSEGAGAGYRPIEWRRTGAVVGGLVGAAVLIGALAGWWSGSSAAEPELAAPALAARPEKPTPSFSQLWQEPAPRAVEARTERPRPVIRTARRAERARPPRQLAASEAERQLIQPPQNLAGPAAADPLAPETPAAPAVAADMPLPHRTVARTIDRIGYRCGGVSSATPVYGAAGVYTVTCTSGQSFQAKPVNGRYRFRRLATN